MSLQILKEQFGRIDIEDKEAGLKGEDILERILTMVYVVQTKRRVNTGSIPVTQT
jgi:hypothetical protein